MPTECIQEAFRFHSQSGREVVARFDGGTITSDGGGVLLGAVERRTEIVRQFAGCFVDHRDPEAIEHPVYDLVAQRVYGLALGYEDLNDHDELRSDPLLAAVVGKTDPTGSQRLRARDAGKALAGKSTLNRLELTTAEAGPASRYKKIVLNPSRSSWTWTPPTIRCTASRKGGSSTGTTAATATCRSTSSAVSTCCAPGCGRRTSTARQGRSRKCSGSLDRSGSTGRRCASSCAPTRGSRAR